MNELKTWSKCEILQLLANFSEDKVRKNWLQPQCRRCPKGFSIRETTVYMKIITNKIVIRETISWKLKGNRCWCSLDSAHKNWLYKTKKRSSKSSCKKDILGLEIGSYRKWVEYPMTPDMNWTNVGIDQVKPITSFDVSNHEELKGIFIWKNTESLLKQVHQQKEIKYIIFDYRFQFIRAYKLVN